MANSFQFTIPGEPDVIVLVEEVEIDGKTSLQFTVSVDESGGLTADLRGLFWDVTDESVLGGLMATGADVTDDLYAANAVKDLGNGANLNGAITSKGMAFDAGVEIGTQGIGEDDIQSTTFVLSGDGDLTLDMIAGMRFGVRLTSVGEIDGDRSGSTKTEVVIGNPSVANDDAYTADEDTVITGNVLLNDTDADDDVLVVTGATLLTGEGDLVVNADGTFEFIPATGFTGEVTFEYTITDNAGSTACAMATITVNEVAGIAAALSDNLAIDPGAVTLPGADGSVVGVTRGPNGTVTLSIDVEVPDLPEVADIMLAQDLSGSFWDDLPNLQGSFVSGLLSALNGAGADDVGFGVASFIDYPFGDFGMPPDFAYQTNSAISTSAAVSQAAINALSTGSGLDQPEAQLVALQQIALRAATSEIGFREEAQRYVVLSTDADFHRAGDYLAGGANDNDTDLGDGTGTLGFEDYPAIAQVAAALAAANITPIFAVTSPVIPVYQALISAMGVGGTVVQLSSNSSNLASAIIAGLAETTTDVGIDVTSDDHGFVTSVTPTSHTDVSGPTTVNFEITLEAPDDYADDTIAVNVPGYGELTIDLSFGVEALNGTAGRDMLTGNGNANILRGFARSDVLDGAGGNDTLIGGMGNDEMTGGSGADTFVIVDGLYFRGTDTVTDFENGIDVIDLSSFGLAGFGDLTLTDATSSVMISVNDGEDDPIVVLTGAAIGDIEASDFIFV